MAPMSGSTVSMKGIVPGRHHQRHAVGLGDGEARGVEVGQVGGDAVRLRPVAHMPELEGELGQGEPRLAHVRLEGRLAQVLPDGLLDLGLVCADGVLQAAQRLDAEVHVDGPAGGEERALARHDVLDGGAGLVCAVLVPGGSRSSGSCPGGCLRCRPCGCLGLPWACPPVVRPYAITMR